ncbi:MAG: hypothetical protein HZA35_03535 [Parcubacteria group bacterium]|nr:hypothetical protein [Parcubacteria group bacterium]
MDTQNQKKDVAFWLVVGGAVFLVVYSALFNVWGQLAELYYNSYYSLDLTKSLFWLYVIQPESSPLPFFLSGFITWMITRKITSWAPKKPNETIEQSAQQQAPQPPLSLPKSYILQIKFVSWSITAIAAFYFLWLSSSLLIGWKAGTARPDELFWGSMMLIAIVVPLAFLAFSFTLFSLRLLNKNPLAVLVAYFIALLVLLPASLMMFSDASLGGFVWQLLFFLIPPLFFTLSLIHTVIVIRTFNANEPKKNSLMTVALSTLIVADLIASIIISVNSITP